VNAPLSFALGQLIVLVETAIEWLEDDPDFGDCALNKLKKTVLEVQMCIEDALEKEGEQ